MSVGNRSQVTALPDELVRIAHEQDPALADELESWRCPRGAGGGFSLASFTDRRPGLCGGRAVSVTSECSATMVVPEDFDDGATHQALAVGIDPGPPRTKEVPVAFDLFFHCEHGHRIYIRTDGARRV